MTEQTKKHWYRRHSHFADQARTTWGVIGELHMLDPNAEKTKPKWWIEIGRYSTSRGSDMITGLVNVVREHDVEPTHIYWHCGAIDYFEVKCDNDDLVAYLMMLGFSPSTP